MLSSILDKLKWDKLGWKLQLTILIIIFCFILHLFRLDKPTTKEHFKNRNTLKDNQESSNLHNNNNNNKDNKNQQSQKHNLPFTIQYLTPEDSYALFKDNQYLDKMNPSNLKARGFESKATCVKNYTNSFQTITDENKQNVNDLVSLMLKKLQYSPVKYLLTEILSKSKIAKCASWLEGNMPHTHQNIIVMPPFWFDSLTDEDKLTNAGSTLIHELVHVEQRFKPQKYQDLYKKWNYHKADYIDNMEEILALHRHNPDEDNYQWIWENNGSYYWTGAVFKDRYPTNLHNINYLSYPVVLLDKSSANSPNLFKLKSLSTPTHLHNFTQYRNYFGVGANHYNPNEIVAQYMENAYQSDISSGVNIDDIGDSNPGYIDFKKEFNLD